MSVVSEELQKKFNRVDRRQRIGQFIRLKGNTYLVTALILINVLFLAPVAFFTWLLPVIGSELEISLFYNMSWPVFIGLWYLPVITWFYSTITFPIKKGHKVLLDWGKTKKGRIASFSINLSVFALMFWVGNIRLAKERYIDYFLQPKFDTPNHSKFLIEDLDALVFLIHIGPVLFTALVLFTGIRHGLMNKQIFIEQFFKWEAPFISRFSHSLELDKCDVITGYDFQTKKPIVLKEDQRFLHEGSFGATGSGKTSTSILLRITQDLIQIATGRRKMGLVFLEPKGDGIDDVVTLAKKLGIPDEKIMVIDPTKAYSTKYNPFGGPMETAAASFTGTLDALTGDQDVFFKGQQNEAATTYTLLAKICFPNSTNILHIHQMFTDPRYLADLVEDARKVIDEKLNSEDLDEKARAVIESYRGVVEYFEDEVLDYKVYRVQSDLFPLLYDQTHRHRGKQVVENKKDKYVTGAKKYLNDIAMNSMLSSLFQSKDGEQVFDADEFLENGGVLLVNTALAELEELSLMFGQFFIRQFQSAVFRRPKEGRIPIFFYVDEFPLYVNESFERMLTLGRSYKVGTLIAMQSLGQLDKIVKGFKETILSNASSKTVFGRGTVTDNKYFSEEFGEMLVIEESLNESASPMTTDKQMWGYRHNSAKQLVPRFTPTDIRELPFKHMIMQTVDENNSIEKAKKVVGKFVHEARFIKPYLKVKKDELKSTEEKEFELNDYLGNSPKVVLGVKVEESLDDSATIMVNENQEGEKPPATQEDKEPTETSISQKTEEVSDSTEDKETKVSPAEEEAEEQVPEETAKPSKKKNVAEPQRSNKDSVEKEKTTANNGLPTTVHRYQEKPAAKLVEQTSFDFDSQETEVKPAAPVEPSPVQSEMNKEAYKQVDVLVEAIRTEKAVTVPDDTPRTDYEERVDDM